MNDYMNLAIAIALGFFFKERLEDIYYWLKGFFDRKKELEFVNESRASDNLPVFNSWKEYNKLREEERRSFLKSLWNKSEIVTPKPVVKKVTKAAVPAKKATVNPTANAKRTKS